MNVLDKIREKLIGSAREGMKPRRIYLGYKARDELLNDVSYRDAISLDGGIIPQVYGVPIYFVSNDENHCEVV